MKRRIPLKPVTSTQIVAIGHDESTNTLAVEFLRDGGVYHYSNVDRATFVKFACAPSIYSHFCSVFKGNPEYPYVKVS